MYSNEHNKIIDQLLTKLGDNKGRYGSEIAKIPFGENDCLKRGQEVNVDPLTILNIMLYEDLITLNSLDSYHISPNGSRVLSSGGWLNHSRLTNQERDLAKSKAKLDVRNAKYAFPISLISLAVAIGSLVYTIFFKNK